MLANALRQEPETLKPAPRSNRVLGLLADMLKPVNDFTGKYKFYDQVPLVGGKDVNEAIGIKGTQSLADDMSYGKPLFNGGNVQTASIDPRVMDLANFLPIAGQSAGLASKLGKPLMRSLGKEAARQIETGTGLLGKSTINLKDNILPPEQFRGATLNNMPSTVNMGNGKIEQFGTDKRIVDLANQYASDNGLPYAVQKDYASVDPIRAKRVADAYEVMKNNPNDPQVKKSFDALVNETQAQYEALRKAGYKFDFMPEGVDIYGNPRNAINDIVTNKHMFVFPTEEGFGSINTASQANPLLQKTGEKWSGKDVTANDMFRAVHDVFGHSKHGVGFRANGEENAYLSHAKMFSDEALPALTSETRGQNSWLNYGPYGEKNKTANTANTIFADQKTGLLPAWAYKDVAR